MLLSFEKAAEKLDEMSECIKLQFRKIASARLQKETPEGCGIGTSDVWCEMVSLVQSTDGEMAALVDLAWEEGLV